MHDPAAYRRERDERRAEIDANRTPEQKAEAARIRADRAAYDALPNHAKNALEELEVFKAFAEVSHLGVDDGSSANASPPAPDIRCTINGAERYFELGEITDEPTARAVAAALKHDEPRGTAFSQNRPFASIIRKKASRTYSSGAPAELVLYYRTQAAPCPEYFDDMVKLNMPDMQALVSNGQFKRVWIFDFAHRTILWNSEARLTP